VSEVTLRDRIRRWWNPGRWRDEHPEVSDGEGFTLDAKPRPTDTVGKETLIKATDATIHGHRH
jgi:hypothetical protein